MTIKADSIEDYLEQIPEDRRESVAKIFQTIVDNMQPGFEAGMQYGGPAVYVPHSVYPPGYHCDPKQPLPFAGVLNQKNHIGIYLFCVYTNEKLQQEFVEAWKASGKKLDMGKSCIRVKKVEDVPLDVLRNLIRKISAEDFVGHYEAAKALWKKSK